MIHPPVPPGKVGFTISSRDRLLPGTYDTETTARYAFFFRDHVLADLENAINAKQDRAITKADLQALRPRWKAALK